ncbi:hypothetical protein D3C72_2141550 [compost metagenome]
MRTGYRITVNCIWQGGLIDAVGPNRATAGDQRDAQRGGDSSTTEQYADLAIDKSPEGPLRDHSGLGL